MNTIAELSGNVVFGGLVGYGMGMSIAVGTALAATMFAVHKLAENTFQKFAALLPQRTDQIDEEKKSHAVRYQFKELVQGVSSRALVYVVGKVALPQIFSNINFLSLYAFGMVTRVIVGGISNSIYLIQSAQIANKKN